MVTDSGILPRVARLDPQDPAVILTKFMTPSFRILAKWVTAGAVALSMATASPARAEPDAPAGEAVLQLLHDKGLVPKPAEPKAEPVALVQQMRDKASDLVLSAMDFLGVRYRRGGTSAEQGFDCSGFTRYVFEHSLGRVLPRRADQQAKEAGLVDVKKDELRPGDLVFFNTMRRAFSHVGIYIGEGKFIHAPRAGGEVRIEDMSQSYWVKRFNGARRADIPVPQVSVPPQ
jgi:cell wall-associated NlpC family hydrolase